MRFAATFAAAFVSALVVAFPILPFGLESSPAVPLALVCGALASGLGAWLAGGGRGRLAAVLAASLASLVVLAVPLGAALFFVVRTNLSISAPIVFAVVAAASAFAARRGSRGPGGSAREGRAGRPRFLLALLALAAVALLLIPPGQLGYGWITACRGEERAVFEEFPQYSPRTPQDLGDPRPDDPDGFSAVGSACLVNYTTPDGERRVREYFASRLEENGWEVRLPPRSRISGNTPPGDGGTGGGTLTAKREGYRYYISYVKEPGNPRGVRLAVVVDGP